MVNTLWQVLKVSVNEKIQEVPRRNKKQAFKKRNHDGFFSESVLKLHKRQIYFKIRPRYANF